MTELVLAYDLGTGGCKASLWDADARQVAEVVMPYPTLHPSPDRNEQRPADWWDAVVSSTRALLGRSPGAATRIAGLALSGQSLGVIALDPRGEPLSDTTPIWSDARGLTEHVFAHLEEGEWYRRTGNGFGAPLYPIFKAATLRAEDPDRWARTARLVGSKDWVNLRLTGELATDHSMASGTGAYDLRAADYADDILAAAGLDRGLFAPIARSHDRVGTLTADAATALNLPAGIPVFAGAVDNAAMALGSRGTAEGRIYAALGSSSWITVTSSRPVLDEATRPYVFAHAVPGMFVSALSTFSSGTSFDWLRRLIAADADPADVIASAAASPAGARGVTFVPTLAGGTPLEGGSAARGILSGLHLSTGTADLVRACLEGIAFSLDRSLRHIRELSGSTEPLLVSGGGARSDLWNGIYADVLGSALQRSTVDQQAATLGAATIAFVGAGIWADFSRADAAHGALETITPTHPESYDAARARFDAVSAALAPQEVSP
ncbi:xylulokinase [Microbacterium oleivorans]|uniref:xylulokinase n=1 Tax=Microbacterium oleivorans TaxID=273677 RepID=UPI002040471A|nr:FGGY family carbohydrate kinase [Microbacterium oleivorans]MCM3694844.1 FGGY family carbohydrate kinase [Microbacterium oleivorans]